jgi:hypothetical protein
LICPEPDERYLSFNRGVQEASKPMVRNMIPVHRPMRFSLRSTRTPEEEAQKASDAKTAMLDRKGKKEKETAN